MTTAAPLLAPEFNTIDVPPAYFLGLPTLVRATAASTGGAFGLIEHLTMPPGFESPHHTHRNEDEAFYVIDGRVAFLCDGQWMVGGPGAYVFGPRNRPHGFRVLGPTPARMLLLCSPGGFEQFLLDLSTPVPAPPDMARLGALAAQFGIDLHGPLPDGPDK